MPPAKVLHVQTYVSPINLAKVAKRLHEKGFIKELRSMSALVGFIVEEFTEILESEQSSEMNLADALQILERFGLISERGRDESIVKGAKFNKRAIEEEVRIENIDTQALIEKAMRGEYLMSPTVAPRREPAPSAPIDREYREEKE